MKIKHLMTLIIFTLFLTACGSGKFQNIIKDIENMASKELDKYKQKYAKDDNIQQQQNILTNQLIHDIFVEEFGGGTGYRYKVKNLKIEDSAKEFVSNKGGVFNVSMDILHNCTSCKQAINQIIVGLSSDSKDQVSVWNGIQKSGGDLMIINKSKPNESFGEHNTNSPQWVRVYFKLKVPNVSGTYYIRSRYAQASMGNILTAQALKHKQPISQEPLNWWKIDRPNGPDTHSNIGKITIVKN